MIFQFYFIFIGGKYSFKNVFTVFQPEGWMEAIK
jgi:hypothetical protein